MARNYFRGGGGEVADMLATGQQVYENTDANIQNAMERRASVQAGRQLATGDRAGAAATFARGGYIDPARKLTGDQAVLDERAYQHERNDKADERQTHEDQVARAKEAFDHMKELTAALRQVPPERRGEFIKGALPTLQQFMGQEFAAKVAALPPEQLSDDQLDVFDGGLDQQWQLFQYQGGITAVNKRSRKIETLREPDKPVILHQGDTLLGDDNRPVYTAPKTFAPRRPASGGGGASGLPPGYVPR